MPAVPSTGRPGHSATVGQAGRILPGMGILLIPVQGVAGMAASVGFIIGLTRPGPGPGTGAGASGLTLNACNWIFTAVFVAFVASNSG